MNYWTLLFASLILYLIPSFLFIVKTKKITMRFNYFLLSIGLVAHVALIYISLFNQGINLNFSNSLLIISWITILFFWFMNRQGSYEGLEYLTLLPAIIILIFHPFIDSTNYVSDYISIKATLHIIIAILGYSLLAFGAIFSIFILLIQLASRLNFSKVKYLYLQWKNHYSKYIGLVLYRLQLLLLQVFFSQTKFWGYH